MNLPTNTKVNIPVSAEVKAFSIPLISIVVVALIVIFAVMPMWNNVSQKRQELAKSNKQLQSLIAKDKELRAIDTEELQNRFEVAELALPSGKEVPALLVGISRLYQEQGLEMTAMKIIPGNVASEEAALSPEKGSNPPVAAVKPITKNLEFNLVLSGSLEQARGFLKTLEKSLRLMVVKSVSFSNSSVSSAQIALKISAPFEPFPALPKDFSEALPNLSDEDLNILKTLSQYTQLTTPFSPTTSGIGNYNQNPFGSSGSSPTAPVPTQNPSAPPIATRSAQTATGSSIFGR